MALTINRQPGGVSFAGDPIIVQATTSLTNKPFIQIKVEVSVTVKKNVAVGTHTEEYTYPVGSDGVATLDVGKTVKSALDRYNRTYIESNSPSWNIYKAEYTITFKEVYLEGVQEITGDVVPLSDTFTAIGGALTEFERLTTANEDTEALIGSGRILSRKPQGERVTKGVDMYIPLVATSSTVNCTATQPGGVSTTSQVHTNGSYVEHVDWVPTDSYLLGPLTLTYGFGGTLQKYIVSPHPDDRHLLFLNGFGLVESITARTRESLAYEVSSEQFVVAREVSYRPNTQVISFSGQPQGVVKMSSGWVDRAWAEWWIGEVLTTRQAWMMVDGRYLPVAIIPDEENVVYDKTDPKMMSVQFEVRYSFRGSTMNTW